MNLDLEKSIPYLEKTLSKENILKFKIGITAQTKDKRFNDNYSEDGFLLMTVIAEGRNEAIIQAEKDLIEYFLNSSLKEKYLNDTRASTSDATNADKLYIVAKKKNRGGIDTSLPPSELLLMQEISLY